MSLDVCPQHYCYQHFLITYCDHKGFGLEWFLNYLIEENFRPPQKNVSLPLSLLTTPIQGKERIYITEENLTKLYRITEKN